MTDSAVAPLPASPSYRLFLVCFGMLQITLAAGLIVGWAGIAGSMMVTPVAQGGAGLTLDQTTAMFGLAASVNYMSPLFLGMLLDHRGPRTCSAVSNALVAAGCFVFASAESFSGFSLGLCGMAFGGPGVQTSLMHLGGLFPARQFFVMGILGESITLSFAIFPLLDVIWEGLPETSSFRATFYVLAVLVSASALCSVLFWPDAPYGSKTEEEEEPEAKEGLLATEAEVVKEAALSIQDQPLTAQLTSGIYLRLSLFFFVTSFWANFYIATVTVELGDQQRFDLETQHTLARQLSFIDAGAIVCAPLTGYMLDSVGFIPTALTAILLGILQVILLLLANDQASILVASFVAYAVFRAFLFPYFFSSLSRQMGFRFFGLLTGISFSVSGVSQLLIAPLSTLVEGSCHEFDNITEVNCTQGNWAKIHLVEIAVLLVLLSLPAYDAYMERVAKSNDKLLDATQTSYGSAEESE